MAEDIRLSKVEILIQQQKFTEAEKILQNLLTQDSSNLNYLSLLAEVYLQQGLYDKANSIIENAIGQAPDVSYLFYMKSRIAIQQDNTKEAEKSIQQALELDPYDADYFALLAHIKLWQKKYDEALQIADQALEIDAENLFAINTRSTALTKLNRPEESFQTIENALREDPNNAYTHSNYGWGLLEKGDHKKALTHFQEALKINPEMEHAQLGILEALKAKNPVYRLFLKYAFWMGNMTSQYQWGFIIGFYVLYRILRSMANNIEPLQPFLNPLLVILAVFAFSTWIISPISNLFLRFNKYGQLLLDKKEKMSSNFVAISAGIFLICLVLYLVTQNTSFIVPAAFGFAMMLPLSVMFSPSKYKNALVFYTAGLAVVGIAAIGMTFTTGALFSIWTTIFILAFFVFQWVANFMIIGDD